MQEDTVRFRRGTLMSAAPLGEWQHFSPSRLPMTIFSLFDWQRVRSFSMRPLPPYEIPPSARPYYIYSDVTTDDATGGAWRPGLRRHAHLLRMAPLASARMLQQHPPCMHGRSIYMAGRCCCCRCSPSTSPGCSRLLLQ